MNIQVLSDNKNLLFKRRELTARLGYDNKTPSRLEIRKELAKKLNAKEELIVVERIEPDYGTPAAKLEVKIYDDEKALKETEAKHMINRHLPKGEKEKKEAPKPAEKPAEGEKKAEAKEEKKEEAKEEPKEEEKPKEEPKKEKKKE